MMKQQLKYLIPPIVLEIYRKISLKYGWFGDYPVWEIAKKDSRGYDSVNIVEKVKSSIMKVKNGEAVYERDSVLFDEIEYSWPILAGLMWVAAAKNNKLTVLDFGGSLGSTYFQNKLFLDDIENVKWCIVEQPLFVEVGKKSLENEILNFYCSIEDCLNSNTVDVLLLSSVLQYLEDPYSFLTKMVEYGFPYIFFDRTPFGKNDKNRLTVQKVPPEIYEASYPCWFFSKSDFQHTMKQHYELVSQFSALDEANIPSEFLGFLFKRKTQ